MKRGDLKNLTCHEAGELIPLCVSRDVSPAEFEALQRHFKTCCSCSGKKAEMEHYYLEIRRAGCVKLPQHAWLDFWTEIKAKTVDEGPAWNPRPLLSPWAVSTQALAEFAALCACVLMFLLLLQHYFNPKSDKTVEASKLQPSANSQTVSLKADGKNADEE